MTTWQMGPPEARLEKPKETLQVEMEPSPSNEHETKKRRNKAPRWPAWGWSNWGDPGRWIFGPVASRASSLVLQKDERASACQKRKSPPPRSPPTLSFSTVRDRRSSLIMRYILDKCKPSPEVYRSAHLHRRCGDAPNRRSNFYRGRKKLLATA